MLSLRDNAVLTFDEFRRIGFSAGISLKNNWKNQDEVYSFLRREVVPDKMQMVVPIQQHTPDVLIFDPQASGTSLEGDGVIACSPDACLTVITADCIPLLLADPSTGCFAAIHIGWRGFLAGIVENTFHQARKSGMNVKNTHVFLGPAINACCFEVGPEVAVLFDSRRVQQSGGRHFVDLREAVRNKVESSEASNNNISGLFECTSCNGDRYYSYRREKSSPVQMVSFIFKST